MLLDILTGKYGSARRNILLLLVLCAGIGFSVMVSGLYAYWKADLNASFVILSAWANVIFLASQIAFFIHQAIVKKRQTDQFLPPPTESEEVPKWEDYQNASEGPDGFHKGQAHWDSEGAPIALDKILAQLDYWTYDRLYEQKRKYEKVGNARVSKMMLNLFNPWTRHKKWKTHASYLRHVRLMDLPKWKPPSPSPTDNKKPKNAVPA
ncbi:MAG: hypothetical protein AAF927_01790 [Bacteroidota bacterium]